MKQATTFDEQVALLKQRGMIINDTAYAKKMLQSIGYYRLGFYWYPFEIKGNDKNRKHLFKEGTNFDDVVVLYQFDMLLRTQLTLFLQRIEQGFRTNIVYYASHCYKEQPTWYMLPTCVNLSFVNSFEERYKALCKRVRILQLHHEKYPKDLYAPAWKTLEYTTFGDLTSLYEALHEEAIKRQICSSFGIKNPRLFLRFMHALRTLRNFCAHGENIYDSRLSLHLPLKPIPKITQQNSSTIGGVLYVMKYFLENTEPEGAKAFISVMSDFIDRYKVLSKYIEPAGLLDFIEESREI